MEEPVGASYFNIFANVTDGSEFAPVDALTLVRLDERRFQAPFFVQEVMRVMTTRLRRSTEA